MKDNPPFRFKIIGEFFGGTHMYGCYFPNTDLCVYQTGQRSTGDPVDCEWIDDPSSLDWIQRPIKLCIQ